MDWTQTNVHSTFGVCWGGMAMMHHFHGIAEAHAAAQGVRLLPAPEPGARLALSARLLGRLRDPGQPLDRDAPGRDRRACRTCRRCWASEEVGPCLVEDPEHRALYIFNHFEYDSGTLKEEYDRDVANGTPINVPINYYPE